MSTVNPSPWGPKPQFLLSTGLPAVGGLLFAYVAGSVNTKLNTYTNSAGTSANVNPIVLNALGEPPNEWWFLSGSQYKIVYAPSTDTDPPTSPIWTIDGLRGINDTSVSIDQWISSGQTPTFVSTTSFTMPGDQTSAFVVGRRLKFTVTAGTVYGTIATSVFGALTTVTMTMDAAQVLDSGLSAVQLALLTSTNISIPNFITAGSGITITYSSGKPTIATSAATPTVPRRLSNVGLSVVLAGNAATLALKGADGNDPSASNTVGIDFRSPTLAAGASNSRTVAAALSTVISSGSTGGTASGVPCRIWVAAIDTTALGGTTEMAWYQSVLNPSTDAAVQGFDDGAVITTLAEGGVGGADSAQTWYSTTARAGVPFAIIAYFDSTQATAGNWATGVTSIVVNPELRPGAIVQVPYSSTGAVATGTTQIPSDDTIPQNTEGDEYMTLAVTPKSASNILRVQGSGFLANSAQSTAACALFRDTTANALAAGVEYQGGNALPCRLEIDYRVVATSITATTFKWRGGYGGAGTTTFNGVGGARLYGGVLNSFIRIEEVMA